MTLEVIKQLVQRITETTGIQQIVYLCNCEDGTYEITSIANLAQLRSEGKQIVYPDKYKTNT